MSVASKLTMAHIALLLRPLIAGLRSRRATATVEFAIVATPFIFLLFAIIESGLIFVANMNLSNATMMLARQLRTGAVMAGGLTSTTTGVDLSLSDFKTAICNKMQLVPVATCTAQLQVDIRIASAFGSASANPLVSGVFNNAGLCYFSGSSGSIVELRSYYLWPLYTPGVLNVLANATSYVAGGTTTAGKFHVLTSSEAFRVEQNSAGVNTGSGC